MELSKHAEIRFGQRGIKRKDLEICLAIGNHIGDEEFFVSNKDADAAIRHCKKIIQSIERLRNKKFVLANDTWVTGYHPNNANMKKMLRLGRGQGMSVGQ